LLGETKVLDAVAEPEAAAPGDADADPVGGADAEADADGLTGLAIGGGDVAGPRSLRDWSTRAPTRTTATTATTPASARLALFIRGVLHGTCQSRS
jgi:hypothetical protein